MSLSRRNFLISTGVAAGSAMVLSACSDGGSSSGGKSSGNGGGATKYTGSSVEVGTKAESQGPAAAIKGAKKGGTIRPLAPDDFSHLDPQRIYFSWNSQIAMLYARGLTGYKIAQDGSMRLVGDLATDAGTMSNGGKTWAFTLKDGLKWQDGSELTVEDVRHGFERGFADFTTEGAGYAQQSLVGSADFRSKYKGPYGGKHLDAIVIDKAKKTITFNLEEVRPDFNFTVAMQSYAPVPVKLDTKEKYDKKPVSCGPYQLKTRSIDKSLVMERNSHWDEKTDPIRNNYPDGFAFEFGPEALPAADRVIADSGDDQYSLMAYSGVPAERIQKVTTDPELKARSWNGLLTGLYYYAINTKRITDVEVRKALNIAWPLDQIRRIYGGTTAGDFATSILSPDILGYQKYDEYGKLKKPAGDAAKAKKMLKKAGKLGQKVVYAFPQSDIYDKTKVVIENALKAAGFDPVIKSLDSTSYYDQIQQVDNKFDVMWFGWAPDWPTGYTLIQPLFDGAAIGNGKNNISQLNVDWVNEGIKKNAEIADPAKAGKAWAALDKRIMTEEAPIIPETFQRRFYLHGSKVGNTIFDPLFSAAILYKLYVKA